MPSETADPEEMVADHDLATRLRDTIQAFGEQIDNDRERAIWFERMIAEDPKSLVELGDAWGVSKERIRQVEVQIRESFRKFLISELGEEVKIDFLDQL